MFLEMTSIRSNGWAPVCLNTPINASNTYHVRVKMSEMSVKECWDPHELTLAPVKCALTANGQFRQ